MRARNIPLVIAAGNDNQDAGNAEPGNCPGVINVAAINQGGSIASYSNYGSSISIAAPGGEYSNGVLSIDGNPMGTQSYWPMYGTSFAAPHVTGVISLMLSVNPSLTPDQIMAILHQTARAFPAGASCGSTCSAGILDAGRAVQMAAGSRPAVSPPPKPPVTPPRPGAPHLQALAGTAQRVRPGALVRLHGSAQVSGARLSIWHWLQLGGPAVRLSNTHVMWPSFTAPAGNGLLTFQFSVRDSAGQVSTALTRVQVSSSAP